MTTDRKEARDGALWALERAAEEVDQCNREGPYQAIGAASRIRALAARVRSGEVEVPNNEQNAAGQESRLPQTASSARKAGESAVPRDGTQTEPAPAASAHDARELLREARDEFVHLAEYWSGNANERAMQDACEHTVSEAEKWILRIDALLAQPEAPESGAVPEGWKLVPVEPTRTMLNAWALSALGISHHRQSVQWAGIHYSDSEARLVDAYAAMLAAAPSPQGGKEG